VLALAVAALVLGGCSQAEYTTTNARDDLVHVGWTRSQAQCFVDGLHQHYVEQYLAINKREAAVRHVKFTGVSPQGTDLYVRNELTNSGGLTNTEVTETRTLVQHCRS